MHTLLRKLVALSVEKYYMALTEIQLKIYRFHGSRSQKVPDPWLTSWSIATIASIWKTV